MTLKTIRLVVLLDEETEKELMAVAEQTKLDKSEEVRQMIHREYERVFNPQPEPCEEVER